MKYILILIIIFVAPIILRAQEFSGLAQYKIGISEDQFIKEITGEFGSELATITEENANKIRNQWIKYYLNEKESPKIFRLNNCEDCWPISVGFISDAQTLIVNSNENHVYYAPRFPLGEILLRNVFFVFQNNTLKLIEFDRDLELTKLAIEKYPPQFKFDTSYKVTCVYVVSGVKETKNAMKSHYTWKYSNLIVESVAIFDYNSDCKLEGTSYTRFSSTDMFNQLRTIYKSKIDSLKSSEKQRANSVKNKI